MRNIFTDVSVYCVCAAYLCQISQSKYLLVWIQHLQHLIARMDVCQFLSTIRTLSAIARMWLMATRVFLTIWWTYERELSPSLRCSYHVKCINSRRYPPFHLYLSNFCECVFSSFPHFVVQQSHGEVFPLPGGLECRSLRTG